MIFDKGTIPMTRNERIFEASICLGSDVAAMILEAGRENKDRLEGHTNCVVASAKYLRDVVVDNLGDVGD